MRIFYHCADLDGKCAGAVVKRKFPEAKLIGFDYGEKFPWHEVDEMTYMVDVSLPLMDMVRLNDMTEFYWIDHHRITIERVEKAIQPKIIKGLRSVESAACELTWKYLFPLEKVPFAVHLLSLYDIWDHENFMVLPFQYGARLLDLNPYNQKIWTKLFKLEQSDSMVDELLEKGRTILFYLKQADETFCRKASFELTFQGKFCLALNCAACSSKVFDSAEKDKYEVFIVFRFVKKKWIVSLYSEKVDVSLIALKYGGGGHPGASGFVCDKLPFPLLGSY